MRRDRGIGRSWGRHRDCALPVGGCCHRAEGPTEDFEVSTTRRELSRMSAEAARLCIVCIEGLAGSTPGYAHQASLCPDQASAGRLICVRSGKQDVEHWTGLRSNRTLPALGDQTNRT